MCANHLAIYLFTNLANHLSHFHITNYTGCRVVERWHFGTDPDPHPWLTDPDPVPDPEPDPAPALLVIAFKILTKSKFFYHYFLKVYLHQSSKIKTKQSWRSHKTVEIMVFHTFFLADGRIRIRKSQKLKDLDPQNCSIPPYLHTSKTVHPYLPTWQNNYLANVHHGIPLWSSTRVPVSLRRPLG